MNSSCGASSFEEEMSKIICLSLVTYPLYTHNYEFLEKNPLKRAGCVFWYFYSEIVKHLKGTDSMNYIKYLLCAQSHLCFSSSERQSGKIPVHLEIRKFEHKAFLRAFKIKRRGNSLACTNGRKGRFDSNKRNSDIRIRLNARSEPTFLLFSCVGRKRKAKVTLGTE